jgi:hypothetical protein
MLRLGRTSVRFSLALGVALGSALGACSGCLSGSYDADFRASLERHRQDAVFRKLAPAAQERAGGRLVIRPPSDMKEQDDAGSQPWSQPPFLRDLPGFATAYGLPVSQGDATVRAVLTVWAPTDKESGLEDLKKLIQQKLQAVPAFATAKPNWAPAEGLPGGTLQWSVLAFQGKQSFVQTQNDKSTDVDLDGKTEIWIAADVATKTAAVLVWRVPETAAASVPVAELAPLVARKVELRAAAEPAAGGDAPPAQ